jgi:hypothetical protein
MIVGLLLWSMLLASVSHSEDGDQETDGPFYTPRRYSFRRRSAIRLLTTYPDPWMTGGCFWRKLR